MSHAHLGAKLRVHLTNSLRLVNHVQRLHRLINHAHHKLPDLVKFSFSRNNSRHHHTLHLKPRPKSNQDSKAHRLQVPV